MNELEMNPYVIQIDKFVRSLEKLSKTFLELERKESYFTNAQIEQMCESVCEGVCRKCGSYELCHGRGRSNTYELFWEVFCAVENYGTELNVELKRKVQKKCVQAPRLLRYAVDIYRSEKKRLLWKQKLVQGREGCVGQLDSFAQMIQHTTRELNASIFADDFLEKKIKTALGRLQLKILTMVFFMTEEGRYEIHLTLKAQKGVCVSAKEVADRVSECCGRTMITGKEERTVISTEYSTITFVESVKYYTRQGIARIGKGCRNISGDSFSLIELPGGKQGAILSDGMGAGERAFQESSMVVELLEDLLNAGFLKDTALQMLNTALVTGREEVRFSTIDMSVFDLYSGKCEITKAGASMTFIRRKDRTECIQSESLPIGVVTNLEIDTKEVSLEDGDLVIMVTDGVMDALPVGEQEFLMKMIIEGTHKPNVKETANHILQQVMECSGELPLDDMTVLVVEMVSLEK